MKTKIINRLGFVFLTAALLCLTVIGFLMDGAGAAPLEARTRVRGVWGFSPTTLAVTSTQTLTPTGSEYHLNNETGVLTLTLASGDALSGDRLRLGSLVTTNTVILTSGTNLAANVTISQNDILEFEFFNSKWVEVINKDNAVD